MQKKFSNTTFYSTFIERPEIKKLPNVKLYNNFHFMMN